MCPQKHLQGQPIARGSGAKELPGSNVDAGEVDVEDAGDGEVEREAVGDVKESSEETSGERKPNQQYRQLAVYVHLAIPENYVRQTWTNVAVTLARMVPPVSTWSMISSASMCIFALCSVSIWRITNMFSCSISFYY